MRTILRITAEQRRVLREHLFSGDGLEAAALVCCGRRNGDNVEIITAQQVVPIPYEVCQRTENHVTWPLAPALPMLHRAADEGLTVLKIHSHPQDVTAFSPWDDEADKAVLETLFSWSTKPVLHLSAFMLASGAIHARAVFRGGSRAPVDRVMVVGDSIEVFDHSLTTATMSEPDLRNRQTFGEGTTSLLKRLEIAVIGTSGTGSWIVEMLARLGIGRLVLIDPDKTELKNLNRIVNSTHADAVAGLSKVEVLKAAVERIGFGTQVEVHAEDIRSPKILRRIAVCDAVFGCVDSAFARSLLNTLATYYLLPYFDLGVRLQADGQGGISAVYGGVHYLLPGGSSLFTRGVIDAAAVRYDMMRRYYPDQFAQQVAEKYIRGAAVDSPAVMPVNGVIATHAIMEFLARLHSFRCLELESTRAQMIDLATAVWSYGDDSGTDPLLSRCVGRGDRTPLLDDPDLSDV